MNTFYKWIIAQSYRKDPIGHLAIDINNDDELPKRKTKNSLLNHLITNNADEECIDSFHKAWLEYKKFRTLK